MRAYCEVVAGIAGLFPVRWFAGENVARPIGCAVGLFVAALLPHGWSADGKSAPGAGAFEQTSSRAAMADAFPNPQAARAACERAVSALRHAMASADTVEVFEGLPHPFERDALAAEKQKATRQLDDQLFYASPQPVSAERRAELESWIGADAFVPYRGLKLCGGFHADYAVRWTWDQGRSSTVLLLCFGCGEARVLAGARDTTDLAGSGKALQSFFGAFRKERPARKPPSSNASL